MKKKQKAIHISFPLSDHFDGKQFFNPGLKIHKTLSQLFKMLKEKRKGNITWPTAIKNQAIPKLAAELDLSQSYITCINHSTYLLQLHRLNILTDPIFSKKAGPFSLLGPKRVREPGLAIKDLPPIDIVLVSHNHYDHMDISSLKKLEKKFQPLFIVPLGNGRYLKKKKIERIVELDWWKHYAVNEMQRVSLVPAQHWSQRNLHDRNKALWGGFWIQSANIKIFFAGDTGYGSHFQLIRQQLGTPDVSLLPIGSYEPRWFMKPQHMNPEEAVLASLDLESPMSIAIHHQTFRLSNEGFYDPLHALKQSMSVHKINENQFLTPENGETIIFQKTHN